MRMVGAAARDKAFQEACAASRCRDHRFRADDHGLRARRASSFPLLACTLLDILRTGSR